MPQNLIQAIELSNVIKPAQETGVHEVKMTLQRSLNEPESTEKHLHIEGLATLIPAMIDSVNSENELGDHVGEVHLNEILDTSISEKREMNEAGKLSGLFFTK